MEAFLIWSYEHRAFWQSNESGYTNVLAHAGRYSAERALQICYRANWITKSLEEIAVPEKDAARFLHYTEVK